MRTRPLPLVALLAVLALLGALAAPALGQDDQPGGEQPTEPPGEPVTPGEGVPTGRVAGDDRIGTAVAISQRAFPAGAPVAYLANAQTTVDAVAGGTLVDGPILLSPQCGGLPPAVADELARLAPGEVLALGGSAAVCDELLAEAGVAAARDGQGGGDPGGDLPDFVVTASAEVVRASGDVPFTVDATDPGVLFEGGQFDHEVQLTGTRDAVIDDVRFSDVLRSADDAGQLVVTGRGCGPATDDAGEPVIVCTDDFATHAIAADEVTAFTLTLHTHDDLVGDDPVVEGTYVMEQAVRWEDDDATDPAFDDGSATIQVTYDVRRPSGSDTPGDSPDDAAARAAVVTWDTPEGSFRTDGHSAADLDRIADGVARGAHIGIPNGVIHEGDGGVNTGRSWHLTEVELADVTVEVCDGTADYVEAHLEDFLAIGRYCPWGAVPSAISR